MSTIIRARSPLRLGLAGGGTDVSPYCDIHGGMVLNATIDRYAYVTLKSLDTNEVRFNATDQQLSKTFSFDEELKLDGTLDLHKAVYSTMIQEFNHSAPVAIEMITFCDAPVGSGLGSSSTLVVTMINAFAKFLNISLDDYSLAQLAFQIERVQCGLQGGRQDQYSATFGGFNFMEFYEKERNIINPLRIKDSILCELEASLLLYSTNVSRQSAKIIAEQSANLLAGSEEALNAMHGMRKEAFVMKECLLKGDFNGLVESFQQGWANKKRSAKAVSNTLLDDIYEAAIKAGALAGKVSGAGGGGFMMFYVPSENRLDVIRSLQNFEGEVRNCHFTQDGTKAWRVA